MPEITGICWRTFVAGAEWWQILEIANKCQNYYIQNIFNQPGQIFLKKIKQNLEIISEPDLFDAFAKSYVLFFPYLKKAKVSIMISHENIKIPLYVISRLFIHMLSIISFQKKMPFVEFLTNELYLNIFEINYFLQSNFRHAITAGAQLHFDSPSFLFRFSSYGSRRLRKWGGMFWTMVIKS